MIDLKTLAGSRYRVTLDESASAEPTRAERLWLCRIPCRHGFISVHGATTLAAFTRGRMVARLLAIPGLIVHQRGDSEARVLFPPDRLDDVAAVLKAKRRPVLSADERARRAERAKIMRKQAPGTAPRDPVAGQR